MDTQSITWVIYGQGCGKESVLETSEYIDKKLYSIGEVSKLCNLSTRTLRYYEKLGLIAPDFIGENSYRYYSHEALLRIPVIKYYKLMNFSLEEIEKQFTDINYNQIIKTFKKSLLECEHEKTIIEEREIITREWTKLIEEACTILSMQLTDPSVRYMDETVFLHMPYHFFGDYHKATINLPFTNFVEESGNKIIGAVQMHFPSLEDRLSFDGNTPLAVHVVQEAIKPIAEDMIFKVEAGLYISKYHIGPHQMLLDSYREIMDWVERKGYQISNWSIERYVTDYWTTANEERFVTEILIPLKDTFHDEFQNISDEMIIR